MSNPFADPQPHQSLDSVIHSFSPLLSLSLNRLLTSSQFDSNFQNPFADPSVQQGLHSNQHEYGNESNYSLPSQQQSQSSPDVQARLDELARREQELAVH